MGRKLAAVLLAVVVTSAAPAQQRKLDLGPFKRETWLGDYAAIKHGLAQHYANLDWMVDRRGLDLVALDRKTAARIDAATKHNEVIVALEDFVAAFGDPHLNFAPRPVQATTDAQVGEGDPPAAASCADAGYRDERSSFAPGITALPGWRLLKSPFPAGVAGKLGVLRIGSFGEQDYLAACARAYRTGIGQRALQLATRAALQRDLRTTIARLRAAGAIRLLVDLTGNGGGSEWDREAAALFTKRAMRRDEPRITNAPCNRDNVWVGEKPRCAVFTAGTEIARIRGLGAWRGPVAILADHRTASAAEEFIGWLVDNRAATLIGETTAGAGCGYMDGGNPVLLRSAPGQLNLPNCARYNAAGRNEVDGWTPSVTLLKPAPGGDAAWGKALLGAVGG